MDKIKRDDKNSALNTEDNSGLSNYKKARAKRRADKVRINILEQDIEMIKSVLKEKNLI